MASLQKRVTNRGTTIWQGVYKNAEGRWEKRNLGSDKAAAQTVLGKLDTDARLRREGFIDGGMDAAKRAAAVPLENHIRAWKAALLAKGDCARHVELAAAQMRVIADGCGFMRLPDINAGKVQQWLADRRAAGALPAAPAPGVRSREQWLADKAAAGISKRTSNSYLACIKGFCRWCVKSGLAATNPLAWIAPINDRTDRRHDRRALSADELRHLLDAASAGPRRFGMTGHERAVLYRVAVETGLRAGELRSLTAGSFSLAADGPSVTVQAAYTKNGQEATLPLRADTATTLAEYLRGKAPKARALTIPMSTETARMLREDLADARQAWLDAARTPQERMAREQSTFCAYRDDAGRCADFHALRHTFISNLVAGGVHPKTAQQLARHSTITLTMDRYSHVFRGDVARALDVLPNLGPAKEALRATGTTDVTALPPPETARVGVAGPKAAPQPIFSSGKPHGADNAFSGQNATYGAPSIRGQLEGKTTARNGPLLAAMDISTRNTSAPQKTLKMAENSGFPKEIGPTGGLGFEPRQTDPESAVLPLHHPPK